MACLNGENCDFSSSPSVIVSRRFPAGDDGETAKIIGHEFPSESVLPVYARGTLNPVVDPVLLNFTNSDYDPIWDSIREEAKLEVFSFCSIIMFLLRKKLSLLYVFFTYITFNSTKRETLLSLINFDST